MNLEDDIERVLFDADEIRTAIRRIADDVTLHYRGRPLCIVAVLKGSCLFAADLIRCIPLPLELAFAGVSSYGANARPGTITIEFLPSESEIARRDVLLVDDILDTGRSMERLRAEMLARGARDVKTCVLLDKPARRESKGSADFVGFEIEDRFVVGYGLDFAGRYRNLPFVGVLRAGLLESPRSTAAAGS
jgi:hypoxanthine phosphoribosyltransferase